MKLRRKYYYDIIIDYEPYCTIRAYSIADALCAASIIAMKIGVPYNTYVTAMYRM